MNPSGGVCLSTANHHTNHRSHHKSVCLNTANQYHVSLDATRLYQIAQVICGV